MYRYRYIDIDIDSTAYSQVLRIKSVQHQETFNFTAKSSNNDFLNRDVTQSYWTSILKQFRNLI